MAVKKTSTKKTKTVKKTAKKPVSKAVKKAPPKKVVSKKAATKKASVKKSPVKRATAKKKTIQNEPTRRDFLYLTAASFGAVGVASFVWPLVSSMAPAADVLALSSIEVDLAPIEVGQAITVTWRGKPVFIRRRSAEEIEEAKAVDLKNLIDAQADADRIKEGKEEWLVMVGICTHLGCVPLGQKAADVRGDYHGWFCPCHGSHYDTSGRIRKGPAPKNLEIPQYEFLSDTRIKIG